ncbi:hypothetical protein EAF04_002825 [Stromatinia cepivora]|nr:hypothetical protein EAF04_002825 [Stromatinia cepivora]
MTWSVVEALYLLLQLVSFYSVSGLIGTCLRFPKVLYVKNLDITEDLSPLTRWFRSQKWLFKGRTMAIEAYAPRKTYMLLPTRKNYCIFISGERIIKEFASSSNFSLNQAYDDLFQYRQNKLWHDQGDLYPYAHEILVKEIADHLARKKNVNGWKSIHHYQFLQYITVSVIGPLFWGESLCKKELLLFLESMANPYPYPGADREFQNAARKYPAQYFTLSEIVQHVPTISVPLVKFVFTSGNKYRNTLTKHLLPIVREQMNQTENTPPKGQNLPFVNFMQYVALMTKDRPYWTPERIILLLESLWRASGSSIPMTLTHIVNSLCQHPKYIEPMRVEIDEQKQMNFSVLERLPLLNSFINEFIRTNPIDSASTRHNAATVHTFTNRLHVPAGNIVCVPSYNIMNDAAFYPKPGVFDGFRFTKPQTAQTKDQEAETRESKVSDADLSFLFWGYGKEACPGRFFASFEMKIVLALLLSRYDFKLADVDKPMSWEFRTFNIPRKDAMILVRERCEL